MRRLRDLGEHGWIARLVPRLAAASTRAVRVGPGDDAAVVRVPRGPLVLTTDALVEGVHFRASWTTPRGLGRRAFAVNASDLAAMGAAPVCALLALAAPPATPADVLDGIVVGLAGAARRAGAQLVGGNLTRGPGLALTVALVGTATGRVVTRAGARPGDVLLVTGALGAAGAAVRRLASGRGGRLPEVPLRLDAGRALARVAHAMIDVSDGLVQDLGHLCRASGVGASIELARLPVAPACRRLVGARAARFAATSGEDYELLVAVPARAAGRLLRHPRGLGCALTPIGRVERRPGVRVLDAAGRAVACGAGGFDHFR